MEDLELERIKQKKLQEMLQEQKRKQQSAKATVVELGKNNFPQIISSNHLVLVDFWAEWCGPCKMMHPVFDNMAKKYPEILFARVNVDHEQLVAQQFSVQSIPTFIMFKDGNAVDRVTGAIGEQGIQKLAHKYVNAN